MSNPPILTLAGKSGTKYQFEVYTSNVTFNSVGAVYVVTKRTDGVTHSFIYVGETGDLAERHGNHHKQSCFDKKGITHICVHLDSSEKSRKAKEADLLAAYKFPCND